MIMTARPKIPHRGGVVVVMEGEAAPRSFEEIAVINASGTLRQAEPEVVLDALRSMAARLGCNAVIRTRLDETSLSLSASGVCIYERPAGFTASTRRAAAEKVGESAVSMALNKDELARHSGEDELILKTGETVRGTLVVVEPERRVIILEDGSDTPMKVLWYKVQSIERGKYPRHVADPPPEPEESPRDAAPCSRPPAPPNAMGIVRVRIETDDSDVQLHRWMRTSVPRTKDTVVLMNGHEFICKAPCGKLVNASMGQEYFFSGPGITDSSRFRLIHRRGDVTIEVRPGSSALYDSVRPLRYAGASMLAVGIPYGYSVAVSDDRPGWGHALAISWVTSGLVLVGVSFVLSLTEKTEYSFSASKASVSTAAFRAQTGALEWRF
ncbi:hypothetical protein [Sorangium sp. So ce1099]|uniref:hypothetical protein n=1 Tax=Sorangium sp. So ce1099 TaxID=3133331 RepID=UPI003F5E1DB7